VDHISLHAKSASGNDAFGDFSVEVTPVYREPALQLPEHLKVKSNVTNIFDVVLWGHPYFKPALTATYDKGNVKSLQLQTNQIIIAANPIVTNYISKLVVTYSDTRTNIQKTIELLWLTNSLPVISTQPSVAVKPGGTAVVLLSVTDEETATKDLRVELPKECPVNVSHTIFTNGVQFKIEVPPTLPRTNILIQGRIDDGEGFSPFEIPLAVKP
jgi:hypothetical protein